MPRLRRLSLYLAVTAGLALTAAAPAPGQRPPMAVTVAPIVEREVPPSMRLVGTARPDRSAVVAAEVSGLIAAFEASEGQALREGDIICRIDPQIARLRLEEAQATLASLKAQLEELESGERPEELARLEALEGEAEAVLAKYAFERQRVRELYETGRSSDKELHDAEQDYQAAARRLAQARAQLELARNGPRAEVIARARHAVAAQQAQVARLERDLAKTAIRAPFDGALVAKRAEVGEWIDAGGAVCELIALDTVKVRADVPERAVPFARAGAPATVEVEALGQTRAATISRVIPQVNPTARTFPVEVDLPNPGRALLPGMFVWTYVPAGPVGPRLMVTKDALVVQGTNKTVFVVRPAADGAHLAMPTPVTTGLELAGEIEIEAPGLKPGDLVVTRGNERLFGPTPVTFVAQGPAAASRPAEAAGAAPGGAGTGGGGPAASVPRPEE